MTFEGLIDGGVFCQDMGNLKVRFCQAETVVRFIIIDAVGAEVSRFDEVYYPNANNELVIAGLADLMASYLEGERLEQLFNPAQAYTVMNSFARLKLEFYQNGAKVDECYQVFYSSNNRTGVFPTNYNYFLSRFRSREVHPEQVLFLAYIYRGQTLQVGVAYYQTNGRSAYRVHELNVSGVANEKTCLHQYLPSDLAHLCGVEVERLIYLDFNLKLDGVTIDRMRFEIIHEHCKQKTAFLFKNLFGVPEMVVMTGVDKRTSELEASFSWLNRKYKKTSTDLTTSHTICTGYIDKETQESVKDAIRSNEVWMVDGVRLIDMVTVTDIKLDAELPRTSPMLAYITYRVSEKVQEKFSRVGDRDGRIFDDTFDDSFE